jgi:transposase
MTKHRSFTPEFKAQVVLEVLTGVRSASEACQHYQLKPEMLSRWKTQFLERAATVFEREDQNNPALARVAELERLVGRLALELEVSKKASNLLESHLSRGAR